MTMVTTAPRILIVDDAPTISDVLAMALTYEGWEVRSAGNGTTALETAAGFAPDAVLLDVMLPDMDGLEVLRRLRVQRPGLPVLVLTARDSAEDRIAGMLAGADGYLTKPFSLDHVVGRLRAALDVSSAMALVHGDLVVNVGNGTVRRGGATVAVTGTELAVLHRLVIRAGETVTAAELGRTLPGGTAAVALCVASLRRKLGVDIRAAGTGWLLPAV
ncbi:response regulator transcription factor [Actinoplanes sp. NPDC049548]|uniref:response regulator transcription factor n=1 Tax=Actinoplanes sp. NPDC049548 TaxID=3155152 RepID=UPI0034203783